MNLKSLLLLAPTVLTLASPGLASAQSYGDRDQRQYDSHEQPRYGAESDRPRYRDDPDWSRVYGDRGDYHRSRRGGSGPYPQFYGMEQHIRGEIYRGLSDDVIDGDGARDLMGQLRDIQTQEWREYRVHGAELPYDDQARIRERLSELDRMVDQTREEQ